jgi:hypothetical protein
MPKAKTEIHSENAYAPGGNAATGNARIENSPITNYSVGADPLRLKIQDAIDRLTKFNDEIAKEGVQRQIANDGDKYAAFSHEIAHRYYKAFGPAMRGIAQDLRKRPPLREKGDYVLARLKGYENETSDMSTGTIDREIEDLRNLLLVVR